MDIKFNNGDLILIRSKGFWGWVTALLIRLDMGCVLKNIFSHIAVYVGNSEMVEAVPGGVKYSKVSGLNERAKRIAIVRFKDRKFTQIEIAKAADVYKNYNYGYANYIWIALRYFSAFYFPVAIALAVFNEGMRIPVLIFTVFLYAIVMLYLRIKMKKTVHCAELVTRMCKALGEPISSYSAELSNPQKIFNFASQATGRTEIPLDLRDKDLIDKTVFS